VDEVIPELKSAIAVLEPNWVQISPGIHLMRHDDVMF